MKRIRRALAALARVRVRARVALAAYPERPIQLIVPWAAGGGTDATARIIGTLLEKELGQPVTVVNRTGGSGVVGHSAIAGAPPDGYTIGIITVEIGMMHWQGLTDLTGASFTPLGARQRRSRRRAGGSGCAVQDHRRSSRRDQGESGQDEGVGHGAGRHLASRHRRHAEGSQDRSGERAVGAFERRRARACRTSSRAACRSRPCRCPKRARSSTPAR